jgi:hypothetical protein
MWNNIFPEVGLGLIDFFRRFVKVYSRRMMAHTPFLQKEKQVKSCKTDSDWSENKKNICTRERKVEIG